MLSFSISYLYIIKFHDFVDNSQEGMKHEMGGGGAIKAQKGMTFHVTLIFTFYFLPWEPDPFQNVRFSSILRLNARLEPRWFSLDNFHVQWEPSF